MDTETVYRLTKHLIRLAVENLTVVQTDPDLTRIAQAGGAPNATAEELDALADKARALSIYGDAKATPKHYASTTLRMAILYRLHSMEGVPYEAWLRLQQYPNSFAIAQSLESGEPYDANSESGRAAQDSVKNALITRCPAFAAAFASP